LPKKVGKIYEKSGNETLMQLAEGYYTMREEAKYLSKLVKKQLQEYYLMILQSSAVITDFAPGSFEFWLCTLIVNWICYVLCGMDL